MGHNTRDIALDKETSANEELVAPLLWWHKNNLEAIAMAGWMIVLEIGGRCVYDLYNYSTSSVWKGFGNSTGGESTFCTPLHKDQDSDLHRPKNSSPGSHDCKKSTWWIFLSMSISFSSVFKWESINWIFPILCIVGSILNAYCGLEDNLKVPPLLQNGLL